MQLNRRTRAAPIARRAADLVWALKGRRCGAGWICRCPAHDDHHPSLSIAERDGKVLIKCWSGCGQDAVLDALRQRGLWEGKARETSQAGRTHALIAERETSLKPCDPMKTFRNAGLFARRSPAGRYLETRGIKLTDDEASSLRFAPALWHWPTQSRWPAMLARVSLATGAEITTHQTFVEPDGSGKAPLGKQARLFAAGGTHDRRRRVVRRGRFQSRVHRRRRHRVHALGHADFRRHGRLRGAVGDRNPPADPAVRGAPGTDFRRSRRARPGPCRGARGRTALAGRGPRGRGVDLAHGRRGRQRRLVEKAKSMSDAEPVPTVPLYHGGTGPERDAFLKRISELQAVRRAGRASDRRRRRQGWFFGSCCRNADQAVGRGARRQHPGGQEILEGRARAQPATRRRRKP